MACDGEGQAPETVVALLCQRSSTHCFVPVQIGVLLMHARTAEGWRCDISLQSVQIHGPARSCTACITCIKLSVSQPGSPQCPRRLALRH